MEPASWGGFVIGAGGLISGLYATLQSSRAQRRTVQAEERAAAFTAADSMIENLQNDNRLLREENRTLRTEHVAEVKALRAEVVQARMTSESETRQCHEALAAVRQDNTDLHHRIADMHKSLIGLRTLIVSEVAQEAARDELGNVDPAEVRRAFRELMELKPPAEVDRRLGIVADATPDEGDRRHVDDFGEEPS